MQKPKPGDIVMALTLQPLDFGNTSDDLYREFHLVRDYLQNTNSSAAYTAEELMTLAMTCSIQISRLLPTNRRSQKSMKASEASRSSFGVFGPWL